VIIVAAMGSEAEEAMAYWRRFPELRAVKNRRVYLLDPDTVCRLGPRLGEGLELIRLFVTGSAGGGGEGG
jgi:ABC-type Fe3+-hydroxamate transport system substrate-binding protein